MSTECKISKSSDKEADHPTPSHEEVCLNDLFPDFDRRERLEALAFRRETLTYAILMGKFLLKHSYGDATVHPEVIDEWYQLLFDTPDSSNQYKHKDILNRCLEKYSLGLEDLPENPTWQDLLKMKLAEWKIYIDMAMEHGWDFERVAKEYYNSSHFQSALKHGADPAISQEALLTLINQQTWGYELETKMLEAETQTLMAKTATLERDTHIKACLRLELPLDTSKEVVLETMIKRWAETLGLDPDQVTLDCILEFLAEHDENTDP